MKEVRRVTSRLVETRTWKGRPKRQAQASAKGPADYPCAEPFCLSEGCYGLGPPIQPRQEWFCPAHLPADYWGGAR